MKTRIFIFIWVISFCSHIQAFNRLPIRQTNSGELVKRADAYAKVYNWQKAIQLYTKARKTYQNAGDLHKANLITIKIGQQYAGDRQFEKAHQIVDEVIQRAQDDQEVLFESYLAKADFHRLSRDLDNVFIELTEAEKYAQKNDTKEAKIQEARMRMMQGVGLIVTGRLTDARKSLEVSEVIYDSLNMPEGLAETYFNLGWVAMGQSDANEAINLLNKAKELHLSDDPAKEDFLLAKIYVESGQAYRLLGLRDNALQAFDLAATIARKLNPRSEELMMALQRTSGTYNTMQQPGRGVSYMQEAVTIAEKTFGENAFEVVTMLRELGRLQLYDGFYNGSLKAFENSILTNTKALDILKASFPDEKKYSALLHYDIGVSQLFSEDKVTGLARMGVGVSYGMRIVDGFKRETAKMANDLAIEYLFLDVPKPDSALKYYQMALIANTESFKEINPALNPKIDQVIIPQEIFRSLMGKAFSLDIKHDLTADVKDMSLALESIQLADSLVSLMREAPIGYYNSALLNSEIAEALYYGVRVGQKLYALTSDDDHAELAYLFMEKSKANQADFDLKASAESIGIPAKYLEEEQRLGKELATLETLIYNEEKSDEKGSSKLKEYRQKTASLNDEWLRLRQELRQNYPNYHSFKFGNDHLSIKDTQKKLIDKGELLISYNIFESSIFCFQIDKSGFTLKRQPFDSTLINQIEQLSGLLSRPGTNAQDLPSFKTLTSNLKKSFLLDSIDFNRYNKVTILPDGMLHQVPFEMLPTESVDEVASFQEFPYLIKTHEVKYATSATALNRQIRQPRHRGETVLAVAPLFDRQNTLNPSGYDSTRAAMGNLAHTRIEVQQVANHFNTELLMDIDATEKRFREMVEDHSMIHVATHGLLDSANFLYSRLLFSPFEQDSINDGYLNIREILGLNVPANMVVLSACNTGSGTIMTGEGVMSLANGFFYSGAKSVIMTLWTANDQSTAEVMDRFYAALAEGQTKSQALRNAKLEYLNQVDGLFTHPYYWAHFTVNGDDSPIVGSGNTWYYWIIVLLIAGFVVSKAYSQKKSAT